jgi:hypothetical protein
LGQIHCSLHKQAKPVVILTRHTITQIGSLFTSAALGISCSASHHPPLVRRPCSMEDRWAGRTYERCGGYCMWYSLANCLAYTAPPSFKSSLSADTRGICV